MAGIRHPTAGMLTLAGGPRTEVSEARPRRTVDLVTQEVHVFAGSPRRRPAPGRSGGHRLPKLDAALTATQAQQVALASLALADPALALLDEATAEAGSAGARALDRAAANVLRGRTALVLAHRLSQAAAADRVIVLDAGRVIETGTHQQLLERGGAYARLWSEWAGLRSH